ncbi:MAG: CBS domain-containing protein [Thermodesulfovibrionia bacterium]|nr:MAG: CBS domain-containing protein [Thermodesulfovibrionia bacterium]
MPLFGELFISELLKKPVLDPKGEDLGRVRDFIVIKGDPLPRVSALILEKKKNLYRLEWEYIGIFNKRIISSRIYILKIKPYEFSEDDLLIVRDILDKQIVDANGAKVVRVNDVKLEGINNKACLTAVDVGIRGILRRFGIERKGENLYRVLGKSLSHSLIRWGYIQPLEPKLSTVSLTVPRQMISALHPADIADIISRVSHEEGVALFKGLDPNVAAESLHELQPDVQKAIIDSLHKNLATDIVERMPPDEAADLLGALSSEKARELLESIEKSEAQDIQELLGHEEDTAGGLMTNEFIAYFPELKVGDAIEKFKIDAHNVETVYYIYVTDKNEKFIGVTSLRDMLLSSPNVPLSEIMETKLKTVTPDTDQHVVAEIISKYNLLAIPVIDTNGVLLGIVTIDDIMDILLPPSSRKRRRKV